MIAACICMAAKFGLFDGLGSNSDYVGSGDIRPAGGGTSTADSPIASGDGSVLETGLPGCPYRFSVSGELLFTDGNPAYGLQLHHPRFLELVGAPKSARLLDCPPSFWVEQLGKEQAMAAAINYNGTQLLCCRIYRYCPSLLWQ